MRKAMMPIRLTFILVIGVIAAFLIIGMLIDWAFNAGKMMDRITKGDEAIPDNQRIDASGLNCNQTVTKYAKLCHAKVTQEQIPAGLCYAIFDCSGAVNPTSMFKEMNRTFGPFETSLIPDMQNDITFTGGTNVKVTIRYEGHLVIE